jgi:CheY-like chemotaxis protein
MLERLGCRVFLAADALDALTSFESVRCEVVLTDVVMPAMTGFDLVECLRATAPELIHLYMSGYPSVSTSPTLAEVARPLIRKPFTQAQLERAMIAVYNDPDCQSIFGSR